MKKNKKIEQKSDEWLHVRKGKITGTTLKNIMGTPKSRQDAIYEIVAERLTVGVGDDDESPMERGVRLEDEAIAAFEFDTGLKVERVGFCESDDNPSIANSPDGLIGEDKAIEVKCMGGKNHVKMWLTNKIPDEYLWQAIQYFVVNEKLNTLYFVGYNPDIPTHPLHIIELNRKDISDEIKKAEESQKVFLKEVNNILTKIIK
jgi:putative phage-type endonuclease